MRKKVAYEETQVLHIKVVISGLRPELPTFTIIGRSSVLNDVVLRRVNDEDVSMTMFDVTC